MDRERELIRLAQTGSEDARNQLLLDNLVSIQHLISNNFRLSQELPDLEQEAILALALSIDKYDLNHPARVRLMTFARKEILGSLSSYLRAASLFPVTLEDPVPIVDEQTDPLDHQADCDRLRSLLAPLIASLDERARSIIRRRVMSDDPARLRVLADDYQISCARVHAIERQALGRVEALIQSEAPDLMAISVHC